MPNSRSHPLRNIRRYAGENEASLLIAWLNHSLSREAGCYKRVESLLRTAQQILMCTEYSPNANAFVFQGKLRTGNFERYPAGRWGEFGEAKRALNRQLARYRFWPQYTTSFKERAERKWVLSWRSSRHQGGVLRLDDNGAVAEFGEADAVISILNLCTSDYIAQVHQCECGRWFFQRFPQQSFCTKACQQKHNRANDVHRQHRRDYMRDYRKLVRSGKVSTRRRRLIG